MNEQSVKALAETLTARPVTSNLSHGFDTEATYASLLLKTSGSQNIERVYQMWSVIQPTEPTVKSVEFDENALTATVHLSTKLGLPFGLLPSRSVSVPTTTLLSFTHGGEHKKLVITKQVDISPIDERIISIPVIGAMWKSVILPTFSVIVMQLAILFLALRSGADISQEKDLKYNAQISQAINTAKPYVAQAQAHAQAKIEKVQPYITQARETVGKVQNTARETFDKANSTTRETINKVNSTAQETIEKVNSSAQPYVDRARSTVQSAQASAQPYIDQAQAKAQPYLDEAQPMIDRAQQVLSQIPVVNNVVGGSKATNGKLNGSASNN